MVLRVKRTLSEPGNNHSAGFGRIHPPGNRIHLSPERSPQASGQRSPVFPVPSTKPMNRDEVTQVTLRSRQHTGPSCWLPAEKLMLQLKEKGNGGAGS